MSPHHVPLYTAAMATSLTLLAFIVAGTSPSPNALLLPVIGLAPPVIMRLWTGAHVSATAGSARRS